MSRESGNNIWPRSGIVKMSDREFKLFSELIYSEFGIKMPPTKKVMLTSRLNKRLRARGFESFKHYYDYVCSPEGRSEEYDLMADVVTTNKTEFFREAVHFDVLRREVLPELVQRKRFKTQRKLFFWSAGCSTGEEAYTLGIVLSEFFSKNRIGDFEILATDISTGVLATGMQAIYREEVIHPIQPDLRRKYLMRGKGSMKGMYRVVPELRKKVAFKQLNLINRDFGVDTKMDVVFCRNVVIYFDKRTQIEFFKKIYNQLVPEGYLFIGSSETLYGINSMFASAGPTVYRTVCD